MRFFCEDDGTLQKMADEYGTQFSGFTGTKVQILTQKASGPGPVRSGNKMLTGEAKAMLVLNLLALLVQKYKY
jgi:hypothetical protein